MTPGEFVSKPLVYIIDDDLRVLNAMEVVLRSKYQVRCFTRAPLAIEVMSPHVRAVILDIKMPEMDGFTAFREIRKKFASLPIIFNAAYQDMEQAELVNYKYGPYGYVPKGAHVREFIALIERAVAEPQSQTS